MEYIYCAMLLHSAGQKITEEQMKKVLTAAGLKPDDAKVKALIASLEGVNIDEVIKSAALPVTAAPAAPAETKSEEKKEEKKEKKKEEVSQEEAAAGLSALFG